MQMGMLVADCQGRFAELMTADLSRSDLEACGLMLVPEALRPGYIESLESARRLNYSARTVRGLTLVWHGPPPDGPRRGQICVLFKGPLDQIGSVPGPGPSESLAAYVGLVASGPSPVAVR